MQLDGRHVSMGNRAPELIDDAMGHDEPLLNLPDGDGETYDAIFVGGGAGGRSGRPTCGRWAADR